MWGKLFGGPKPTVRGGGGDASERSVQGPSTGDALGRLRAGLRYMSAPAREGKVHSDQRKREKWASGTPNKDQGVAPRELLLDRKAFGRIDGGKVAEPTRP